jgi:putative FmdB family regulatory protein
MPMYEFFCADCNTIFTFFSRTVNTDKIPQCPQCGQKGLERMISRFAVTGRAQERAPGDDNGEGPPGLPAAGGRMEKAMETLASEAESIDENNPEAAAGLMRRFSAMTGMKFGDRMEDALARLESGEDPESLEKDLAGLDENDLFKVDGADGAAEKRKTGRKKAPARDETLYEM